MSCGSGAFASASSASLFADALLIPFLFPSATFWSRCWHRCWLFLVDIPCLLEHGEGGEQPRNALEGTLVLVHVIIFLVSVVLAPAAVVFWLPVLSSFITVCVIVLCQ